MSITVKICTNETQWRTASFEPTSKLGEICPSDGCLWFNCRKLYDTSDPQATATLETTLGELGVVGGNVFNVYTGDYKKLKAGSTPSNIVTVVKFSNAASKAFNEGRRRKRALHQFMNNFASGSGANSDAARRLVEMLQGPSQNAEERDRTKAKNAFEVFKSGRGSMYALDAPELFQKYEQNPNMTFEEFYVHFKQYLDELKRRSDVMKDPTSEEGQRLIQEQIDRQRIENMYNQTIDFHPEHLIPVTMLYISLTINGRPVKAFVDSGAQVSLMSLECAKRCNLLGLVDRRFQMIVCGVGGKDRAVGKIHLCDVKIEGTHFSCPFVVTSNPKMDLLIGLDCLRKHNCCINLAKNCLEFPDGTSTRFLQSNEVEDHLKSIAVHLENEGGNSDEPMDQSG